ncbi:hypothetical protein ACFL0B_04970 [Thermodesulfobacteriota bacterium]
MTDLINGLYEEYRILQNKIDKIADFGLKVRGWCITLQSALIVAVVSGKFFADNSLLIVILMFLIVALFQFLEQEQIETRKILSQRARKVEYAIDRLVVDRHESSKKKEATISDALKSLKGTPRTAIDLSNYGRKRTIKADWSVIHHPRTFKPKSAILSILFCRIRYSSYNPLIKSVI